MEGELTAISIDELIEKLTNIPGVRAHEVVKEKGKFKLGMQLPEGKGELIAIIDVHNDRAYFDVSRTPRITPPSYLLVNDVLSSYELQFLAPRRSKDDGIF